MKKGFTLVELLAVIVILAVILIIAIPKITNVIDNSKLSSFTDSAKLIASQIDKQRMINEVNGDTNAITCNDVSSYNSNDYTSCTVGSVDSNGNTSITLVGAGKFEGLRCTGTSTNMNCTNSSNEETELACSSEYCYLFGEYIREISGYEIADTCESGVLALEIVSNSTDAKTICDGGIVAGHSIEDGYNEGGAEDLESAGVINLTYSGYNEDIKTDWREVKDSSNNQRPVFLKFKNDLSEKYVCTLYSSSGSLATEPTCFTSEAYNNRAQTNSEWSTMQDLFGSSNCHEDSYSVYCNVNPGSMLRRCESNIGYAACHWGDCVCDLNDQGGAACVDYDDN